MRSLTCLFITILIGTTASPQILQANPPDLTDQVTDEAKARFEEARTYFDEGEFDKAAQKFREAYKIKPAWRLLFNIGHSEAAARHHGRAYEAFELYLVKGGDDVDITRQDEIQKELTRLRPLVGTIELHVPDGARIRVDNQLRGHAPDASLLKVSAGILHHVVIEDDGKVILDKRLKVSGQETRILQAPEKAADRLRPDDSRPNPVTLVAPRSPQAVGPNSAMPAPSRKLRIAGWSTLIGGGALLAGASITGAMTLSLNSRLKKECVAIDACGPELHEDVDRFNRLRVTTTILLATGAAATSAGLIILLIDKRKNRAGATATYRRWRFVPAANATAAFVTLHGSF